MTFMRNARGITNGYDFSRGTLSGVLAISLFSFAMLTLVAPSMASNAKTSQSVVVAINSTIRPVKARVADIALLREKEKEESGKEALVEYLSSKYSQSKSVVGRIVHASYLEGSKYGISPILVLAIIEKESSLRVSIRNSYDAQGLMQVVPMWHPDKVTELSHPDGLLHPETNIQVGTAILSEYLGRYNGDTDKALKRYSGSAQGYAQRVYGFQAELQDVLDTATALKGLEPVHA